MEIEPRRVFWILFWFDCGEMMEKNRNGKGADDRKIRMGSASGIEWR